ncbi:hypothetical protein WIX39_022675 [Variovorax sp. AB1(2024)]|uniref:hypothetical protein n=1 Tax=Variovorax sp. AB1(2024) TaxID=3132214 RepID=UPI0030A3F8C0
MNLAPYRLWHQALQYVPLKYWEKRTRALLGSAQKLSFEKWWEETEEYFETIEPFLCEVIETPEDARQWSLWEMDSVGLKEAVLLVSLEYPIETLLTEVERKLRALKQAKKGRPPRMQHAEFPLAKTPNVRQIERLLEVYYLRNVKEMKLWEVAVKMKLAPHADKDDKDGRNVLNATTSRMMKQADKLIRNASQGVFPSY